MISIREFVIGHTPRCTNLGTGLSLGAFWILMTPVVLALAYPEVGPTFSSRWQFFLIRSGIPGAIFLLGIGYLL